MSEIRAIHKVYLTKPNPALVKSIKSMYPTAIIDSNDILIVGNFTK